LDEVIGASFEEFMDVYKKTAMELSWDEIEALNDVSTEQWVQEETDDQNVIDFFRFLDWLFGGTLAKPTDYSVGSLFYSVKIQIEALGHHA
jgi:hypothetical protein